MIVRLNKEEIKEARRRLLSNDVYAISHDALKAKNPEYTLLSPAEIYLSATEFVKVVTGLSDIDEGLGDEMDDLLDEATNEDEAMLIMIVAALQLRALSARSLGRDYMPVVQELITRWVDHPYLLDMIGAMSDKEQSRTAAGKKTKLLEYELQALIDEGADAAIVRDVLAYFVGIVGTYDVETIKGNLLLLEQFNIDHGHQYNHEIEQIRKELELRSTPCQTYIAKQEVDTQINGKIEAGGIGVSKNYHQ